MYESNAMIMQITVAAQATKAMILSIFISKPPVRFNQPVS